MDLAEGLEIDSSILSNSSDVSSVRVKGSRGGVFFEGEG
jgi:hypothetical protein